MSQHNLSSTVSQDISVIQILREINFGVLRSSKTAVFDIIETLKMVNLVNFSLQNVQKVTKLQIRVSNWVKMGVLHF